MKEVKPTMFKKTSKFQIAKPTEMQLAIMRGLNHQSQDSEAPQNVSEKPVEAKKPEETEIPDELKLLAQKWRENLRLMANARFTPAIMVNEQAFYVLQNLPPNFDSKTSITTITIRGIGEDLRVYEVVQKIHMDRYGRVLMLGNEVKPIEKPADFGITADVVIQIVKGVAEGSSPLPVEFGLK
jgi:hypothetical protein